MPVTWSWKHRIGSYVMVQTHKFESDEIDLLTNQKIVKTEVRKFKINIYRGNCLGVCIYEFRAPSDHPKDVDKKTGKPKIITKYTFQGFWNDLKHLENMLGLHPKDYGDSCYDKKHNPEDYMESIKFNTYYSYHIKEFFKVVQAFTKQGIKVSFYYKEPREEKKNGKRK